MAQWPNSTSQWQRLRRLKLQEQPLCEPCERIGRIVPATAVDPIVSINGGDDAFSGLDELMSLCASCHNAKTRNVDQIRPRQQSNS